MIPSELTIDALIGLAMPVVIAVINQSHWSPRVRGAVAFVLCLVAATVVEWVRGDLSWEDWRNTALVIFGAAVFFYRQWWQPSTIAPAIEAATSPSARAYRAGAD